jgi:4'-phosphopantetheinyl transferase
VDARGADERLFAELLSSGERERAAQIVSADTQRRWIVSRAMLRELLARYVRCDASALALPAGPGKPTLRSSGQPPLHFSLSHSRGVALYALARAAPVGVDVEATPRARRSGGRDKYVALALRTCGVERARVLARLAPEARERAFLRDWTAYEAELKRRGLGIGAAAPVPGLTTVPAAAQATSAAARGWIERLDLTPHAVGAVAAASPPRVVRRWSLSDVRRAAG